MGQMIPKFRKEKEEKPIGGCMSSPTVSYEAGAGSEGRKYQPKNKKFRGISTSCSGITLMEIVEGAEDTD